MQKIDLEGLVALLRGLDEAEKNEQGNKNISRKNFLDKIRIAVKRDVVGKFKLTIWLLDRENWRLTLSVVLDGIRDEITGFMDELYLTLCKQKPSDSSWQGKVQ